MRFSAPVEQMLQQSGWQPNRIVDSSTLSQWYAFKWRFIPGYCRIFPVALTILREFGGLSIGLDKPGNTCYCESIYLDPLKAVGIAESGWIAYEWLVGETLYPIGVTGDCKDDVLAVTTQGKILYLPNEWGILLAGVTIEHALENLIVGNRLNPLEFPDYDCKIEELEMIRDAVERIHTSA